MPASWLTAGHVHMGRNEINLSELNAMPAFPRSSLANQMAMQIRSDQMPPKDYRLIHAGARLSAAEKEELIAGLQKTFANFGQSQAGG